MIGSKRIVAPLYILRNLNATVLIGKTLTGTSSSFTMLTKYQYTAGVYPPTGEVIFSRAQHDYRETSDGNGFIDGGREYTRNSTNLILVIIELDISPADLYNDYNNNVNKYGIITTAQDSEYRLNHGYRILFPTNPEHIPFIEKKDTFDYRKKYFTWGTYGKDGKGPRRSIMLTNAEPDHLKSILSTQFHIGQDTKDIICSILNDRRAVIGAV